MPHPPCPNNGIAIALASVLGDDKVAHPGSPAYQNSVASYYSVQQATIRPACVVFPRTATLTKEGPSIAFGVRSGGHTGWAGASNIAGGVTLDLTGLNDIEVTQEGTIVRVGTGATWDAMYQKLHPLGRTVAGGRVAGVGAGGLTLGGGISHLSPQRGWKCDTVLNFQVVLSDGQVVNANADENADLFFALRGGGGNFGIIEKEARALGAYDPFVFLSYAMPDQNPIASYGEENVRRLVAVRDRVDPAGMFTKQVPGRHKIHNA
ncbi:oxidoreductase FAD-binding protein [Apiospora saccharicola]|uniref:Oxidoreductase FAD-binding protein n=1 Tax=Apiospora saccharicola TaxID=335842 RepID=A0ABR1UWN4_9PEZI